MLRFGSELIFYFCDLFKVNVIIIENKENKSFEEEGVLIGGVPSKIIGEINIKRIIKHI